MGAKHSTNSNQNGMNFRNKPKQTLDSNIPNTEFRGELLNLDEVYESLEDYKEAINNVYSLNSILEDSLSEINEKMREGDLNAINTVLSSTLHEGYNKNVSSNYCEIIELAKNKNELNNCRVLFTCKQYEELDGMSLLEVKTNNTSDTIDELSYVSIGQLLENRIIEMSMKIPQYGKTYIHSGMNIWTNGIRCYFNLLRKNPLSQNSWIMISSGINMKKYTQHDVTNLNQFSREYKLLMESITQVMNSNTYLNVIDDSVDEATQQAETAVAESEEKNALYNFAQKVYEAAPTDVYAKAKLQDAHMAAQTASRMASQAVTNAKAAQYALTEAETQVATKTTTWEYGSTEDHEYLHCVYSGLHPQWNGQMISDCNLRGSSMDIPGITFSVMTDMEKYYPALEHNQTILCSYKTQLGYYISIVKIIKHGDDVHIQMKEAHLNAIFNYPIEQPEQSSQYKPDFEDPQQSMNNNVSGKSYIFIDPSACFIGIGTNQRNVKYIDDYITAKTNNLQHVVVKSQYYPNFVSTRIAENKKHTKNDGNDHYYFDQFSCATMRRESELYDFNEMVEKSTAATELTNISQRYGGDISFEITDKTKKTIEIGSVGMVIDKIDEDNNVYGGLSVKTLPNIDMVDNKSTTKPGNTIMYVSSDGILQISGVMLGSKILHVQKCEEGEEQLFWGDTQIV
jgi:hypothetical protein